MLVSVVVTSYNYDRFLHRAIDSALRQTHRDVEVVVVDDGSTDGSREIIEGYGNSVIPVFKENGGHASSFNAGFAVSRGEVVCPLDSDDAFAAGKVERVVAAWKTEPRAFLACHQLQTVDPQDRRSGRPWPAAVWNADISGRVARSGGWWPRPTTSGLCFSRSYLERVLPMPTGPRIWPDTYLAPPAAMLRPVIGLQVPLGNYRRHGGNTILKYFPEARTPSERREVARRLVEQYTMENQLLNACLRSLLDEPPYVTLDGHPEFQSARRIAGEAVSLLRVLSAILTCPTLTHAMKMRTAVRALLGR